MAGCGLKAIGQSKPGIDCTDRAFEPLLGCRLDFILKRGRLVRGHDVRTDLLPLVYLSRDPVTDRFTVSWTRSRWRAEDHLTT